MSGSLTLDIEANDPSDTWTKTVEKSGILPPLDELFLQLLGLGMLGFAAIAYLTSYQQGKVEHFYTQIFVQGFLFNYAHTGFTFALLLQVAPLRELMRDRARPWGLHWGALAAAVAVAGLWATHLAGKWSFSLENEAKISWTLFFMWGNFHWISQTRGFSSLYTRKTPSTTAHAQKTEKLGFTMFSLLVAVGWIINLFSRGSLLYSIENKLILLAGLLIVLNSLRFKNVLKTFYLLRIFAYPFIIWNPLCLMAAQGLHGTEYFLLSRRMFSGEAKVNRFAGISLMAISIGFGLCMIMVIRDQFAAQVPAPLHDGFQWFYALALSVSMMHYFLDSFLFRFRNSSIRENVGPLISAKAHAAL